MMPIAKDKTPIISFDPRTKLVLLIFTVIIATLANRILYQGVLIALIAIIGILSREYRYSIISIGAYMIMILLLQFCQSGSVGALATMLLAWLGLMFQVFPCGMLAGIIIRTTKMGEFLAALNKLHIPKKIVIPLAIMIRYIPTIREDWQFIKDAMKMRDVSPSFIGLLTHPGMTVECLYVPLLLAASKAADELTIASVTRGIENPKKRTSLTNISFGLQDGVIILCFVLLMLMVFGLGGMA